MPANKLSYTSLLCLAAVLFLISCGGGGGATQTTPPPAATNPVPQISALTPTSVVAGSASTTLKISGSGFVSSSTVQWGTTAHSSTFISASEIQMPLTDADISVGAAVQIKVTTPSPGGGSASATFTINNPLPSVSSISPASATAGQLATTVTVTGSGFVSTSTVNANGSSRPTTFVSSTQLQAVLPASDFASSGSLQVTVSNASPGGGTSPATTTISIVNPLPVLQSISPATVYMGTSGISVTLTGTGFTATSVAQIGGATRYSTYMNGTRLQLFVTQADLQSIGTMQVSVTNPAPGGGTSSTLPLPVVYPVPLISGLTPSFVAVGTNGLTLSIDGDGFYPTSIVNWNGSPKPTQFFGSMTLHAVISAADIATTGTALVTVSNPAPGGGTSLPAAFNIDKIAVYAVNPTNLYVGTKDVTLDIYGGGFENGCIAKWSGTSLTTTFASASHLQAVFPASLMLSPGTGSLVVTNPDNSASDNYAVNVLPNPVPVLSSVFPASAPAGAGPTKVSLSGSGFTSASSVSFNGTAIQSSVNGFQLQATIPATLLQKLGVFDVNVTNPGPGGGGTTSSLPFSTYLPLATNDLVYSKWSKLLYASVPSTAGSLGNSVVAIDPVTGNVVSSVFVGSEPNKVAISDDGKVIWVGLDATGKVRKVDLTTMTASTQFRLGGGIGVYNPPFTALDIAVLPGAPDTIAVFSQGFPNDAMVSIFDSGVPRSKSFNGGGYIAFDSSGSKLYTMSSLSGWYEGYSVLTIDASGIASHVSFSSVGTNGALSYDNGRIYTTNGTVLNADTGALIATFYTGVNQIASGRVAPDSINGKVFILDSPYSSSSQIHAFDSSTFVTTGTQVVSGLDNLYQSPGALVRWGQNGLAFRTKSQIYILQSTIVKDMSATPADVSVAVTAPAVATTGVNLTFTATVVNHGPSAANGVVLIDTLPGNATIISAVPAQGSCVPGSATRCNLGTIANGSSVQVQFTAVPNFAGPIADTVTVYATEPDPDNSNNDATAAVDVTGTAFNPVPSIVGISPQLVQAGSATFTLTVTGSGFVIGDAVHWNGAGLPTTFVDGGTLTATVDSAEVASLGYAWVSVFSPAPGGGNTASLPLAFYRQVNLDTSQIVYEPFSGKIYASVPSTATQATGNSIVAIDPVLGTFSSPVNIGSQPNQLALSDDSKYLFVGLDGSNSIARFNLATNTTDLSFTLGTANYGDTLKPRSIAVAPGNPNLLAVDTSSWTGIALYDIAGSTATIRAKLTGPYTGSSIAFGDSTHVYSYDSDTTGAEFRRWTVASDGLTLVEDSTLNGFGGFSGSFKLSKGLAFGAGGGVAEPTTTKPLMLGKFAAMGSVAPDAWLGRAFFLACDDTTTYYCNAPNSLMAFDQATFRRTDRIPLSFTNVFSLIRWGKDGLAFQAVRAASGTYGAGSDTIYIMKGPLVLPQLAVSNVVPTLDALSPNSAPVGGGNIFVTVVGSQFVPGVVARWNGVERTTYFVDSHHLNVAIPGTDFASSGTAAFTVLNPGSSSPSSALTFTIAP